MKMKLSSSITALTFILSSLVSLPQNVSAKNSAFPGAVGFGAGASGGRGGKIYAVTNTKESGTGSLRWALSQPGPRIIIFKTGGVIPASGLQIPGGTTIFAQTAPGDGIALRGGNISVTGDNVIIRGLRIFGSGKQNGLRITGAKNVIIDHSSIAWVANESFTTWQKNFNISNMTENVTLQYTAIYEGLAKGENHLECGKGGKTGKTSWNAHGGLWMTLRNFTYYRNAMINMDGRAPTIGRPAYQMEVVNSIYLPIDKPEGHISATLSGNKGFQYAPNQRLETLINLVKNKYKFKGFNVTSCKDYPPGTKLFHDGSTKLKFCTGRHAGSTIKKSSSPVFTSLIPNSAIAHQDTTEQIVLNNVGPVPRDRYLTKAINDYKKNNRHFQCPQDLPALRLTPGTYPTDSDNDGIPDSWENRNGLDSNNRRDALRISPSGYMWIEEYANSLINMPNIGTDKNNLQPPTNLRLSFSDSK